MFPSITVCNLNQVTHDFIKLFIPNLDIHKTDVLIKEFIVGREHNLTQKEETFVNKVKKKLGKTDFRKNSRQYCKHLFISILFQGMNLTWKQISSESGKKRNIGPMYHPTDYGSCCLLVPHLDLKPINESITVEEMYRELKADAVNGEKNGLEIILDAEQYNYAESRSINVNAAGFKISLHHHQDKPMMQFSSQLIHTGTATQINVKPIISYTTNNAIGRFTPDERGCYANGEANLTYLVQKHGYRYQLNNCLIDRVIRDIIWECRCVPYLDLHNRYYLEFLPWCTGKGLHCLTKKLETINIEQNSEETGVTNNTMIDNLTKPMAIKCLPDCQLQENTIEMSYAQYPQPKNFFYGRTFCEMASHLKQKPCTEQKIKKIFLKGRYPNLCPILEDFDKYFGREENCSQWPENFFGIHKQPNTTLEQEMYNYARDNLAYINVMIQSPYVTKIKKDEAMTFTNYIANAGGLLGLCLGFSFISCIEMFFWSCRGCKECKNSIKISA